MQLPSAYRRQPLNHLRESPARRPRLRLNGLRVLATSVAGSIADGCARTWSHIAVLNRRSKITDVARPAPAATHPPSSSISSCPGSPARVAHEHHPQACSGGASPATCAATPRASRRCSRPPATSLHLLLRFARQGPSKSTQPVCGCTGPPQCTMAASGSPRHSISMLTRTAAGGADFGLAVEHHTEGAL